MAIISLLRANAPVTKSVVSSMEIGAIMKISCGIRDRKKVKIAENGGLHLSISSTRSKMATTVETRINAAIPKNSVRRNSRVK